MLWFCFISVHHVISVLCKHIMFCVKTFILWLYPFVWTFLEWWTFLWTRLILQLWTRLPLLFCETPWPIMLKDQRSSLVWISRDGIRDVLLLDYFELGLVPYKICSPTCLGTGRCSICECGWGLEALRIYVPKLCVEWDSQSTLHWLLQSYND